MIPPFAVGRRTRRGMTGRRRERACRPALAGLEGRLLLSAGDLDPAFGVGGVHVEPIPAQDLAVRAVAVQPDGKIVVAGGADHQFFAARFNPDGGLDTGFGAGGQARVKFSDGVDTAESVAIQPDGKIVLAGVTSPASGNSDFALARLDANGALDPGFGSRGERVVGFEIGGLNRDHAWAVAIQPGGNKIVAAGSAESDDGSFDIGLIRLDADGSLDAGFAYGGYMAFGYGQGVTSGADEACRAMGIQPDGKIVVAGRAAGDIAAVRFTADGLPDGGFGSGSVKFIHFGLPGVSGSSANSVALQPDGKVVLGGLATVMFQDHYAAARLNPDGSLDGGFGAGGLVEVSLSPPGTTSSFDRLAGVAVQGDGRVVLGGWVAPPGAAGLTRLNADGTTDTGFGTGGEVLTDTAGISVSTGGIALQADGKIVHAGGTNASAVFLARYLRGTVAATDLSAVSGAGTFAGPGTLRATLTAGGAPLAGKVVAFTLEVGGVVKDVGTATTGADGVATLGGVSLAGLHAGGYVGAVGARFAGDPDDASSAAVGDLAVARAPAALALTGLVFVYDARPHAAAVTTSPLGLAGVTLAYARNGMPVGTPTQVGTYTVTASLVNPDYVAASVTGTLTIRRAVAGDYNGDGKAELALYKTSTAAWFVSGVYPAGLRFGRATTDFPTPGNYDGTGKTTVVNFTPSTGLWYLAGNARPTTVKSTDDQPFPVPGDYSGAGKDVPAVFQMCTGQWWISGQSRPVTVVEPWVGDVPVPADYDGDGKLEEAIYRPETRTWYVLDDGKVSATQFGGARVIPVPGDYSGTGKAAMAVFDPRTGQWSIRGTAKPVVVVAPKPGDIAAPGDYDGTGKFEPAIYRPSTGTWYILNGGQVRTVKFGGAGLVPANEPNAYYVLDARALEASTGQTISTRASSSNSFVTSPTTGPAVWMRVPDPAHPGSFLPSYFKGRSVQWIAPVGNNKRTATWTFRGLSPGYYKVEAFYPQEDCNATRIMVQKWTGADPGFVNLSDRLDESKGGTPSTTQTRPIGGVLPVRKNLTPFRSSNATSYIWVPSTISGTWLSIRLSDSGDGSHRRMVADTIRVTFIGAGR